MLKIMQTIIPYSWNYSLSQLDFDSPIDLLT